MRKGRETFSLLVIKYFRIDDGSGSLPVISSRPLPVAGQKLRVTGVVREAFSLGDQQLTVLVEAEPERK